MPGRLIPLVSGEYYHIFNRGNNKRPIFLGSRDYKRFLQTFYYYQQIGPKPRFSEFSKNKIFSINPTNTKLVEIISYCLMPNHFHFLLKQLVDNGIAIFISQLSNSYTKYFNNKYGNVGALLQGAFKSVLVEDDAQLLHVSRYIHLNPIVSGISLNLEDYKWSSFLEYMNQKPFFCTPHKILDFFPTVIEYKEFIENQREYGEILEFIKHHDFD